MSNRVTFGPVLRSLSKPPHAQCSRALFSTACTLQATRNSINDLLDSIESTQKSPPRPSSSRPQPRPTETLFPSPSDPSKTSALDSESLNTKFLQRQLQQQKQAQARQSSLDQIAAAGARQDMERQLIRKWRVGDVYAPHDLSFQELRKWRLQRTVGQPGEKISRRHADIFDEFALNPVKEYKNFALMSEYTSDMGRIKHSRETGLRPVNQRKIAKAIRRAIGIGIMPSVHTHPELMPERVNYRRGG